MTFTTEDAKSLMQEVQENRRKLDSCRAHRFQLPDTYTAGMYTMRFPCINCGGLMQYRDIKIYCDGYIAAGGRATLVMGEVGG